MRRSRWAVLILAALGLVLGLSAPALASQPSSGGCGSSGAVTTVNGTLSDGATYEIQCPAGAWNGTLFLYSHGYVTPGSPNASSPWRMWGPYVSGRQWGTVREDYSADGDA